jgi:hypothetical protein
MSVSNLVEGGLKTMHLAKLKSFIGLALLVGAGLLFHRVPADRALLAQNAEQTKPAPADRAPPSTKDKLTPESFSGLHKLIHPEPGEYRWDEVTWMTSIWHARKKAAAEDKPIFIFYTQGAGFNDPLGNC